MSQTVDTPDYQRGVVSAQAQLASVAGGTGVTVCGIPPNAETLIVTTASVGALQAPTCQGVTTGVFYAGGRTTNGSNGGVATWFFDVSNSVDTQVTIAWNINPVSAWYVYSDAGVHLVMDIAKAVDIRGVQYVGSVIPGTLTGDHPPNEVNVAASDGVASGATIFGAPGAGKRYRLFSALVGNQTAAGLAGNANSALRDSISGAFLIDVNPHGAITYGPSGIPLSTNAAIATLSTAGTLTIYTVVYSIETV